MRLTCNSGFAILQAVDRRTAVQTFCAPAALRESVPMDDGERLLLIALRRIIAHGHGDPGIANHFRARMGDGHCRPLMLVRVLVAEVRRAACTTIEIAPCCCARMTSAEATLIRAAACWASRPETARLLIADLLGNRKPDGVLASLAAVVQGFADHGVPIGGWR